MQKSMKNHDGDVDVSTCPPDILLFRRFHLLHSEDLPMLHNKKDTSSSKAINTAQAMSCIIIQTPCYGL
jgi:hypothetical protein